MFLPLLYCGRGGCSWEELRITQTNQALQLLIVSGDGEKWRSTTKQNFPAAHVRFANASLVALNRSCPLLRITNCFLSLAAEIMWYLELPA